MLFAEPPVKSTRYSDPDVRCAKCNADDSEAYFKFIQQVWQDHQIEASRQSAAIVRRIMQQQHPA